MVRVETSGRSYLPVGIIRVLGESNELKAAQEKLLVFGVAALVTILLLLQAALGNFRLALLTFALLPMALVGGVVAVLLSGAVLSLGSLVGFLAVFGIAARNGILMVSHFQQLQREEGMEFGRELVIQGATERLAPILMTALATGLALVPLVVAGSSGHEIEIDGLVALGVVPPPCKPVRVASRTAFGKRRTKPVAALESGRIGGKG